MRRLHLLILLCAGGCTLHWSDSAAREEASGASTSTSSATGSSSGASSASGGSASSGSSGSSTGSGSTGSGSTGSGSGSGTSGSGAASTGSSGSSGSIDTFCRGQADGIACDGGNPCFLGDACANQVCTHGAAVTCDTPPNACFGANGTCDSAKVGGGDPCVYPAKPFSAWSWTPHGIVTPAMLGTSLSSILSSVAAGEFRGPGQPPGFALGITGQYFRETGVDVFASYSAGRFNAETLYPTTASDWSSSSAPLGLLADDVNGDGNLDLVTADVNPYLGMWIFYGDGGGGFPTARFLDAGGPTGNNQSLGLAIAAGRFNGDGFDDLALAAANSTSDGGDIHVFLSYSDGGIRDNARAYPLPGPLGGMASLDVNRDGLDDLVIADTTSTTLLVRFALPDGGFTAAAALANTLCFPTALATGKFVPADPAPGLAEGCVTASGASEVRVLGRLVDGGITVYPATLVGSRDGVTLSPVDFNGDGLLDLAVSSGTDAGQGQFITPLIVEIRALLGAGDGGFTIAATYDGGVRVVRSAVTAADFNGDGLPDVAMSVSSDVNFQELGYQVLTGQCQ